MIQFEVTFANSITKYRRKLKILADDFADAEQLAEIDSGSNEYIYSITVVE